MLLLRLAASRSSGLCQLPTSVVGASTGCRALRGRWLCCCPRLSGQGLLLAEHHVMRRAETSFLCRDRSWAAGSSATCSPASSPAWRRLMWCAQYPPQRAAKGCRCLQRSCLDDFGHGTTCCCTSLIKRRRAITVSGMLFCQLAHEGSEATQRMPDGEASVTCCEDAEQAHDDDEESDSDSEPRQEGPLLAEASVSPPRPHYGGALLSSLTDGGLVRSRRCLERNSTASRCHACPY